jgi:hypothetical protein
MANIPVPLIEVIGPAGAGKSTLLRLINRDGVAPPVHLAEAETLSPSADALICTCPASADHAVLRSALAPIAEQLNRLVKEQGHACAVGALPVFLVLTKCDLLVQPLDTLGDWLERIEACKLEAAKGLSSLLKPGQPRGFGSPALHYWATAQQRPALTGGPSTTQDPFGVRELLQQARTAAADHRRRRELQGLRLHGLIWLTAGLLLLLALVTAVWIWTSPMRRETAVPEPRPEWPQGDLLVQGQATLADAQRLLRFEAYRPGSPPVTEWPRWYRDAQTSINDLKDVRERLTAEKIGQALTSELQATEQDLRAVQQRAVLFGLAGDLPQQPRVLHFPAEPVPYEALRKQVQDRLERLRQFYPDLAIEPPPEILPLGIVIELEDAASISYEKLLLPVQTEIRNRVVRLGDGRETPQAWKDLTDGWLSLQAENELYEWRELAILLQRLAGQVPPTDPLTQLGTFLREPSFPLPLERIELVLPSNLKASGEMLTGVRPADAPLTITRRSAGGEVTTLNLLPLTSAGRMPGEPDRYAYGVARQNPLVNGRLIFKPGDEMSARVKIIDDQGGKWLLTWPLAASRSQVYSFAVLSQPPQLHAEEQTHPSKGPIAFSVRLVFSEPRLFELPDLLPP